ncbi:NADP-dependent oxidoreductase [Anseongella ginsenosidimutans]|nr:NADP-dependent oxidoreductase [Anseongella ginsenosidimutans]
MEQDRMNAALFYRFGPADVLRVENTARPAIGEKDVLIRVVAAGLNPVDTKIRAGTHISCKDLVLPAVPGKEVSGRVAALGGQVSGLVPGDPVFAFLPSNGGFAGFASADASLVVKKPENVPFETAASVSLAGMTACQAIHEHLELAAGEHVLIQAAAGGVGHLAVQFAKMAGARVSGTASGDNAPFLVKMGADQPIDYKTEKFEEKAAGVDAVLDAMGGEVLYRSISCVKPGGRVVCLPSFTKNDPKAIALARERNVRLIWPMMHPERDQLLLIAKLLEEGKLQVEIHNKFPLEKIVEANQAMESHGTRGKNVIIINESHPLS